MKQLFIVLFIAMSAILFGEKQNIEAKSVAINDDNFPDFYFQVFIKNSFDTNKDGKLSDKECAAITEINVGRPSEYRSDLEYPAPYTLEGIEFFPNLKTLDCTKCGLYYLDISKNKKLEYLNCSYNNLEKLYLKKNTKLETLSCTDNKLKKIDISQSKKLKIFYCSDNKIKKINLDKNRKLEDILISGNLLKKIDITKLSNLKSICCGRNKLKKLDVSKNKKLNCLECHTNKLTKLNVSKNKLLDYLHCGENAIRKLDLRKNKLLTTFRCDGNRLLTGNVKLSRTQLTRCEAATQKAIIKIKKIGRYYYIPLANVVGTNVISNLSYGKLTSKGIRVKKSNLPKTITYNYNMFTDGEELTKVTIRTKK